MRMTQADYDKSVARIASYLSPEPAQVPVLLRAKADDDSTGRRDKRPAGVVEASSAPILGLCRACGLPIPETEYQFHPGRRWRFDYAWPRYMLALEVEGALWKKGGGAHSHPLGIQRDIEKYSEAAILGWRVLRATTDEVRDNVALDRLRRAFNVLAPIG
jgi:hypothetical protein